VAYIVIKSNGEEVERRELEIGVVIGRAPDCDITVRDILLSRRHCRLSPSDDGWVVQDLQSKNGTVFNGEPLRTPRVLADNDVVRLGRSKIIFHAGALEDDFGDHLLTPARPHNPGDSLAGTLSGFQLLLPGEGEIPQDGPCPQPRPKDPAAYDREELQTLLSAIASSSWDSVYAEARQPVRSAFGTEAEDQAFEAAQERSPRRRVRPSSPTDFSLQANPPAAVIAVAAPPSGPRRERRRLPKFRVSLHAVVAAIWAGFLVLLSTTAHKPTARGSIDGRTGAAMQAELDAPPDADVLKAADKELLSSPKLADPRGPKLQLNGEGAKEGLETAGLFLPLIW
jgi:predicted component of type VI protein secretion system